MKQFKLQKLLTRKTTLLFAILAISFSVQAQVTIGAGEVPHQDALLDLKENEAGTSTKGMLLPRVALTATNKTLPLNTVNEDDHSTLNGMIVYNTTDNTGQTGPNLVYPGLYMNDGLRWVRMVPQNTIFFYAPAIVVPTDPGDALFTTHASIYSYDDGLDTYEINLYEVYRTQFGMTDTESSTQSPGAGRLPIVDMTELGYFVTYFDKVVFTGVEIDDNGKLKYKTTGAAPGPSTFMNVIFRIK